MISTIVFFIACSESLTMASEVVGNYRPIRDSRSDGQQSSDTEDSDIDVASVTSSIDEDIKQRCRGKLQMIFKSTAFHYIIISLVILDALLVLFEFLLGVGVLGNVDCCIDEDKFEQREFCFASANTQAFRKCAPPATLILQGIAGRDWTSVNKSMCECGFRKSRTVCVSINESKGFNPALVLHVASLCILTMFMVELLLKMITFRLKYFRDKFDVFDGIVIVYSWAIDVASLIKVGVFEVFGLLILLRLWQMLRIVNGFTLVSRVSMVHQLKEKKREAGRVIHAYHRSIKKRKRLERENSRLQNMLGNEHSQRQ